MHSKYWSQRFDQIEQSANNQSTKYIRSLEKKYTTATSEIDTKINAWYRRIAKNNSISVKEAKKLLAGSELDEFKWTVEEYIKFGQQNAIDQSWMKELENASAKFHISRLEAMKLEARQQVERLFAGGQETMYDVMSSVYKDSFYHSCFEIQKGVGVGFDVSRLDDKQVRTLLQKPWSVDGTNFSEKLWGNKRKLINTLDQELSRMVLTGESPDKAIKNIRHAMGTSLSSARRLVLTEQAYFTSIAQKDAYAELGVEEFEFVGTLDGKTCDDCGGLDGQHFPMKDMIPGVNAAPMHPYCRCTTAPYFDDEFTIGKRIAKDEDGEYYEVPEKMTFDEWKETFRDGGSKDGLTQITSEKQLQGVIDDHVELTDNIELSANEIATNAIRDSYEHRRIDNGINFVPFDELDEVAGIKADFADMDERLAKTSAEQFALLSGEYETTCQKIVVEKFDPMLGSVPASTEIQMHLQSSKMSFNRAIVKDGDKFRERMQKAVERGQFPQMTEEMYDKYVVTHEFAHTLMDFGSPLKNYVGAETKHIASARKEIKAIRDDYMKTINSLNAEAKAAELKALSTFDETDWKVAQDLQKQVNKLKISKYADMSVDDFMAEAFTDAKLGNNPSEYSKKVEAVIDKYFRRK